MINSVFCSFDASQRLQTTFCRVYIVHLLLLCMALAIIHFVNSSIEISVISVDAGNTQ